MKFGLRASLALGALLIASSASAASSPFARARATCIRDVTYETPRHGTLPAPPPARHSRPHATPVPRMVARSRPSSSRSRVMFHSAELPAAVNLAPASLTSAASIVTLSNSQRLGVWRSAGRGPPRASPTSTSDEIGRSRNCRWEAACTSSALTERRIRPAAFSSLAGPNLPSIPTLPEPWQDARSYAARSEGMAAWTIPPSGGTP